MSSDVEVVCMKCKKSHHLGQRFAGGYSFGYGTHDADGQAQAFGFLYEHLCGCGSESVRVMGTDSVPEGYESMG